jgi:hypothetical protein
MSISRRSWKNLMLLWLDLMRVTNMGIMNLSKVVMPLTGIVEWILMVKKFQKVAAW